VERDGDDGRDGHDLGALIRRADGADRGAADELFAMLYDELHRLAEHHLRRGGTGLTLGPTTLLHEAYLNVAGRDRRLGDARDELATLPRKWGSRSGPGRELREIPAFAGMTGGEEVA
jgi:hypothetical protein